MSILIPGIDEESLKSDCIDIFYFIAKEGNYDIEKIELAFKKFNSKIDKLQSIIPTDWLISDDYNRIELRIKNISKDCFNEK